ncbi:hypothetical protein VV02_24595 [Luteipulveratus mongoliensis]|uniref:Isoprenyl transferase n=1 Tax=Luteipulveratus mongoliensis TaxID=571913 RepID=A0A0K1JRF1_9MICO|nr:hypothetical protein VV02_24595 [Luteipulveratus mongoliensis]
MDAVRPGSVECVLGVKRRTPVGPRPRHVGLVMDGNRRWARAARLAPSVGHRAGARHMGTVLSWCEDEGIDHVTIFVASALNLRKRDSAEVANLMELLETVIAEQIETSTWRLHVAGDLSLVPATTRDALQHAMDHSAGRGRHLTLAVGYDWQGEVVESVRSSLAEVRTWDEALEALDERSIAGHLRGGPSKDIDLVVRTSGEQRLSGFFPWETTRSELFFVDHLWPDFSREDFDAALAHYASKRTPTSPVE